MPSSGLKDLILNIVEARSSSFGSMTDRVSLIISNGVRHKLERYLKKIAPNSQSEIVRDNPSRILCRLQDTCMDALNVVPTMSSAKSVETITDAFTSARITLLVIFGQPNERKICSDELISIVLSTLHKTMNLRQSLSEKIFGQKSKHLEGQTEKTLQIPIQFMEKVDVSHYISSIQSLAMHNLQPDVCRRTTAKTMQLTDLLCILTEELRSLACLDLSEPKQCKLLAQARKFVRLIGSLSRYCDSHCQGQVATEISDSCKHWDVDLTTRTLLNLTDECQPIVLRLDAVMSVSFFCRSWPDQFRNSEVHAIFYANLRPDRSELHTITIPALSALFDDEGLVPTEPNGLLAFNMHDRDRIGALLVPRYLDSHSDIATTSEGSSALEAAKLLAVVSTEGLVPPHEICYTWVWLGISINLEVRCIATKQ